MKKGINITIYISDYDIIRYINVWRKEYNLHIGFLKRVRTANDFEITLLKEQEDISQMLNSSRRIVFSTTPFKLEGINNSNVFMEQNPNILTLLIEKKSKNTIRESWFSTLKILEDDNSDKLWRKLGRIIKKESVCGAFAHIVGTDKKNYSKHVRYTNNVKKMYNNGTTVLGLNDKVRYELTPHLDI